MFRFSMMLLWGLFFSDIAFGDRDAWGYMPRQEQYQLQQQQEQLQRQQQEQQPQYRRRDDYDRDNRYSYGQRYPDYQGYQGYQGYQRPMPSPPMGYRAPAEYYGLPPVRGFVYPQQPNRPMPGSQPRRGGRW